MVIKRVLTASVLGIVSSLIPFQAGHAARIYNDMDIPIQVGGGGRTNVTIPPGERSDSIEWGLATEVTVWAEDGRQLCNVGFGLHTHIRGGNYMIVAPIPGGTSCVVCDSNRNPIAGTGQCN